MANVVIDKDVPMPVGRRGAQFDMTALLRKMEVGDSFFFPNLSDSFRGNCYWRAAFAGIKVTVRKVTEDGVQGVRVWRIEDVKESRP